MGEGVEADRIRGRVRASVADLAWRGAEEEWTVASFFLFFFVSFFFFCCLVFLVSLGWGPGVCVRACSNVGLGGKGSAAHGHGSRIRIQRPWLAY